MESEEQLPEVLKPIADKIPDYLFYLMFHATRQREMAFDAALADVGLNINRLRTLSVIQRLNGCTMKDLARLTAIDRTTLTRAVDQLVEQGLVERSTPAGDRRKVQMCLSPEGEAFYREATQLIDDFNRRALAGVGRRQQVELLQVLNTVIRNISGDSELAHELITFGGLDRHRAVA
ncbi:MarR family winged helix-turn-helix transcriptional regulator [Caulobacter sp. KR2-114]|uniref:MarR family winged helix-turn-helix transcriptional regulator n=1 Tax=Caulobacter sp. KR2-114 TaxID=3400912 RepID=UPI003C0B2706